MSIVFIYFYQAAPAADKYPQFSESNGGARFCSSAADSFPSRGFLPPPLMTEMSLDHGVLYHAAAFVRYCRNARPFPFPQPVPTRHPLGGDPHRDAWRKTDTGRQGGVLDRGARTWVVERLRRDGAERI